MSGEIIEGGRWHRPSYSYKEGADSWESALTKLAESNRNVNENILVEIRETNRLLARLDRRLSHVYPLNGRSRR